MTLYIFELFALILLSNFTVFHVCVFYVWKMHIYINETFFQKIRTKSVIVLPNTAIPLVFVLPIYSALYLHFDLATLLRVSRYN